MQHLEIFPRWRCIIHDCGSYNFNQLVRHEIDVCVITTESTVGVVKPKTFGGYNGDVGRAYLKDYQEATRQKQINESKLQKWLQYRAKKIRDIYRYKKKFAYKITGISKHKGKRDQNR